MRGMENLKCDISRKTVEGKEKMEKERQNMDVAARDHEISTEARSDLALQMTDEGARGVLENLTLATDAADRDFNEHDGDLDAARDDSVDWKEDLDRRVLSGESDLEKTNQANEKAKLQKVQERIDGALRILREDLDFIEKEVSKNVDSIDESERERIALQARIEK
jgi:hypothetical protein